MTIVECYQQLGGNLENVKTRLPSDSLIKRFIIKFLDDSSYSELCDALQKGQRDEAFRAAHTLKGVCANLGFDRLGASASKLTELIRSEAGGIPEEASLIMDAVKRDHAATVSAIRTYLSGENCPE